MLLRVFIAFLLLTKSVIAGTLPLLGAGGPPSAATFQAPGPSQSLFNNPYYSCVRNFYVATTGSDSNSASQAQNPATPWLTIAKYDAASGFTPTAGDCVNVAPGTYATGVIVTHGGSSATSTGYIVYRCTVMDACIITDSGGETGAMSIYPAINAHGPNYVMFDGFTLTASSAPFNGIGFQFDQNSGTPNPPVLCCHHVWVLNSIASGYGQAGFQGGVADFVYIIHNTFHDNAMSTGCGAAQGSGITMVIPKEVSGYTLTADDKNNSITGNLATQGDWFRQVYSYNIVYNNRIDPSCGPGNTDGNGIIMDTFAGTTGLGVYAHQVLISFNVAYNNGGKGIHIFLQDTGTPPNGTSGVGITVANNTSFNNNLDTGDTGTERYEIGEDTGSNNTFVNNIAYAIAGSGTCSSSHPLNCNFSMIGSSGGGFPSHFNNNVAYCTGGPNCADASTAMNNGAVWTAGKGLNDPLWVDVGKTSVGTETTQPNGKNFSLCIANGNPSGCTAASPALGYLLSETYIPSATRDSGACDHSLTTCP